MQGLVPSIWAAGGLQLVIAAANVLLPGRPPNPSTTAFALRMLRPDRSWIRAVVP